ncbi:unnamed protein product [Brachionus calyciflorus]|uniref:TIR domain-containing protein n=1 Tax=Brachionus calyciflorus TaxID=104777 RepID=A0A813M1F5_9BILA|nr:unnamed protein product [Brachionus calyciflorus]
MKTVSKIVKGLNYTKQIEDKCSKTLNGSKIIENTHFNSITSRITDKLKFKDDQIGVELELRLQLDKIIYHNNLQHLITNEKYLTRATNFFKSLTPDTLANDNLIIEFEFPQNASNLHILLYLLKDGTKRYFHELNTNKYSNSLFNNEKNYKICRKKAKLFMALTQTLSYLTYYSKIFRVLFVKNEQNIVLEMLSDKEVLSNCFNIINREADRDKDISNFIRNSVEFLINVNRTVEANRNKILKICYKTIKLAKNYGEFLTPSFMFIYKQGLTDIFNQSFIKRLMEEVNQISSVMASKEKSFPIYFDSSRKSPLSYISNRHLYLNIIELLDTFYYLMSDRSYESFFLVHDITSSIKTIILNGNHFEAEYAIRILLRLCFFENFKIDDPNILSMLKQIIIYQYPNKNLIRYCEAVLWVHEKTEKISKLKKLDLKPNLKSKIMISHDSKNNDTCLEIETELKKNGFMVWFKDIKDYSLESTFLSILSSDVVLLVLSNDLCHDLNCRIEYEFAIECGKKILPLILNHGFVPKLWVEDILKGHQILDLSCLTGDIFTFNLLNSISRLMIIDSNDSYKSYDQNLIN